MGKTWKSISINRLKFRYGKYAQQFKDARDDRLIVYNVYNNILEGLESLDDDPALFVKVAMNHAIKADCEELDEIIERFKDR